MATQRFYNLDENIQQRILTAAREEFAAHGFERASLNTIIRNAAISKGSMYYYFEDKADLYLTLMRQIAEQQVGLFDAVFTAQTAGEYWAAMRTAMAENTQRAMDEPDLMQLGRGGLELLQSGGENNPLTGFMAEQQAFHVRFLEVGQSLGAIRTDLPMPLLLNLFVSVTMTFKTWLLHEFDHSEPFTASDIAARCVDLVQRTLDPQPFPQPTES